MRVLNPPVSCTAQAALACALGSALGSSQYITSIEESYDIFDHGQSASEVNVEPERGDEQRVQR
jgi:hypothetical protein